MAEKTYVISIEGQSIPVPAEIGSDDAKVRAALAPYFPDAANALITRKEDGDRVTVNVVKKAGSKGAAGDVLLALVNAPTGRNPAVELYARVKSAELGPLELLEIGREIDRAMEQGAEHGKKVDGIIESLRRSRAMPAPVVPVGF